MVIKVYLSLLSGNMEIKRKQDFVLSILGSRKIPFELIDISDPAHEGDKKFMREHSSPAQNETVPFPPQIFNDNVYCGDYDGLFIANENVELLTFLKLEQDTTTVEPHSVASPQSEVEATT